MKPAISLKSADLEPQFAGLLRGLIARVPFLKLISLRSDVRLSSSHEERADRVARLRAGSREWTLVVEEKRLGQPREIQNAALRLAQNLRRLPASTRAYGVVVAPFISEESARICEAAGIGYADLAGNVRLSFDQVFIETRSAENPLREKRETRSIFAPKAARVLRVLLQGPLRPWKVKELAETAQVSLGWVSAVRQQLLAKLWADEEREGLRVTKPDDVLDAWVRADDWRKRFEIRSYSTLHTDAVDLATRLVECITEDRPIFTQWIAGWLRRPYTQPPIVTAYVKRFPDDQLLREKLLARRVPTGGSLWLVVPKDEGVWNPTQTVKGFELVSDVQIYLDLVNANARGEEQAAELRKAPDFSGGWA